MGKKHGDTILNKQKLKKIKLKGNTACQMATVTNNSVKGKRKRNRRVTKKLLKTVYFLPIKKWTI